MSSHCQNLQLNDQHSSVSTLVIEAGVNDIKTSSLKSSKRTSHNLLTLCWLPGSSWLFPACCHHCVLVTLNSVWLKGYCMHKGIPFVDSFAALLNIPQLFIRDCLHPNLNARLNFSQLINELTHPNLNNPSKSNVIDLIFSNRPDQISSACVFDLGISDPCPTSCVRLCHIKRTSEKIIFKINI